MRCASGKESLWSALYGSKVRLVRTESVDGGLRNRMLRRELLREGWRWVAKRRVLMNERLASVCLRERGQLTGSPRRLVALAVDSFRQNLASTMASRLCQRFTRKSGRALSVYA